MTREKPLFYWKSRFREGCVTKYSALYRKPNTEHRKLFMTPDGKPKLILASRSPRRRELLEQAGYDFEVILPDESVEDGPFEGLAPEELVAELAQLKAENVLLAIRSQQQTGAPIEKLRVRRTPGSIEPLDDPRIVLGGDTVAECEGHILGKPVDRDDARRMLQMLSGRRHYVWSGLCLWPLYDGLPLVDIERTVLFMDTISDEQIETYLDSGAWVGKAGAFGYQDGLDWIRILEGTESNVVGLPMELLAKMLASMEGDVGQDLS